MRRAVFGIAHALLGVMACAWPLDVYQHVPLTGQTVVSLAGAILVLLWLLDLAYCRVPRVPFELFWPVALIALAATVLSLDHTRTIIGLSLLFFAALHFARGRASIERWLTWSAVSCAIAAFADVLYRLGYGWPTAYALSRDPLTASRLWDAASATSGTLANGSATLAAGVMLWGALAFASARPPRFAVLGFLLVSVALAANLVGIASHMEAAASHWLEASPAVWVVGALTIWLVARIAAKIIVDRERSPGAYALIAAPLVGVALVFATTQALPMAWHAWAAALAAGYVIRDKRIVPVPELPRIPVYVVLVLLPFVAFNAYVVDESNSYDGRNYAADLRADYEAGAYERLMDRVDFWYYRTGESPAQGYWAARAAIDLHRPHAAAAWADALLRRFGAHGPRGPMPTSVEIQQLLNRFRDYVSAMPENERSIAYERALSAGGDAAAAEASLRLRIADANPVYESIERAPLQRAVEFLFNDLPARIDFDEWTIAELLAVLDLVDARAETAPEEIDRSWLPAAVVVRRDARGIAVCAVSAAFGDVAYEAVPIRLAVLPVSYPEQPWSTASLPFDASWQIEVRAAQEPAPAIATVTFDEDGQAEILLPEQSPESVPDEPAVFIWLP